jgi:hypothetical protein
MGGVIPDQPNQSMTPIRVHQYHLTFLPQVNEKATTGISSETSLVKADGARLGARRYRVQSLNSQ